MGGASTNQASCRVTLIVPAVTGLSVSTVPSTAGVGKAKTLGAGPGPASRSASRNIATATTAMERPDELLVRSYRPFQLSAQLGAVNGVPASPRRGGRSMENIRLVITGAKAAASPSDVSAAPAARTAITLADLAIRSVNLDQDALLAQVRVEMPETVAPSPGFTAEVIVTVWQFQ